MKKFNLYKDVKYTSWDRYCYQVEAESLEEAIEIVKNDSQEWYDCDALDVYESIPPEENGGMSTVEILDDNGNVLYRNGD